MPLLRFLFLAFLVLLLSPALRAESTDSAPAPAPASAPAPIPGPGAGQGAGDHAATMGNYVAPPAAPGATPPAGAGGNPWSTMAIYGVVIGSLVLMMWMSSRRQRTEEKRLQALREGVKRGDQVVTIGGMYAEVMTTGEGTVDLRIGTGSDSTVARFNKSAIATVLGIDKKA